MDLNALLQAATQAGVILVLAIAGLVLAHFANRRALRVVRAASPDRRKQLETIVHALYWIVRALIVGVALLMLLGNFVDIAPLLASAGVAGLAVSLAAQSLIKDFIGGFLILVEGQYRVGDVIQVGDKTGSVERVTLRATYVRDVNGSLHIIPNGEVRVVTNVTRDWSRAMVDVGVAYEEDMDRALGVLKQAAAAFAADPELGPQLLEPPQVLGPLSLGDWAVTVRVMVKTPPGEQWGVAMELRKRILAACEREGISLPYPRQEVFVRQAGDGENLAGEPGT